MVRRLGRVAEGAPLLRVYRVYSSIEGSNPSVSAICLSLLRERRLIMQESFKSWIDEHDERWSFILFYVGAAILLSIYATLFWVTLLMLCHYGLEIWRHYVIKAAHPILHALWEVKLDVALILFAFVITLYSDMVMAALGIGQAARAGQAVRGAQMLTRFAVIERALRIFFLTVDDITRVLLIGWRVIRGKNGKTNKKCKKREKSSNKKKSAFTQKSNPASSQKATFSAFHSAGCASH